MGKQAMSQKDKQKYSKEFKRALIIGFILLAIYFFIYWSIFQSTG